MAELKVCLNWNVFALIIETLFYALSATMDFRGKAFSLFS